MVLRVTGKFPIRDRQFGPRQGERVQIPRVASRTQTRGRGVIWWHPQHGAGWYGFKSRRQTNARWRLTAPESFGLERRGRGGLTG